MKPSCFSLFYYLLLIILLSSSFVLTLVILTNYYTAGHILLLQQNDKFNALTQSTIEKIDRYFVNVEETVAQNILLFSRQPERSYQTANLILTQTIETHPVIFGSVIVLCNPKIDDGDVTPDVPGIDSDDPNSVPNVSDNNSNVPENASNADPTANEFRSIYVWRNGDSIVSSPRTNWDEDSQASWFRVPFQTKKPRWSEPYFDPQINVLMVTYSAPIIDEAGEVEAIITADVSLDWIEQILKEIPLGEQVKPVLFSQKQAVLIYSDDSWILNKTIQDLAENDPAPKNRKKFEKTLNEMKTSEFGNFKFELPQTGERARCYYRKLLKIGWAIGYIIPERLVYESVYPLTRRTILFGFLGTLLLILPSYFIARSVSRPLTALSSVAEKVAQGKFDVEIPRTDGAKEITTLVRSFDSMRVDLRRYVDDVAESARLKARMSSELNVAHNIQLGIVPKDFSLPREKNIELFATMEPAQEVGGDLYDFSLFDLNHFYFCIGDVSGKGIPASLFMAVGKTLLRTTVQSVRDPALALRLVNNELFEYNDASLFITMFCGIYNFKTGELDYANAGHNPPVVGDANERFRYLDVKPNLPLAIMNNVRYENQTTRLEPNQKLLLYTDGVTEAVDQNGELYGSQRLLDYFNQSDDDVAVEPFVRSIMNEIHHFSKGVKQSDDITLLMFANRNDVDRRS